MKKRLKILSMMIAIITILMSVCVVYAQETSLLDTEHTHNGINKYESCCSGILARTVAKTHTGTNQNGERYTCSFTHEYYYTDRECTVCLHFIGYEQTGAFHSEVHYGHADNCECDYSVTTCNY